MSSELWVSLAPDQQQELCLAWVGHLCASTLASARTLSMRDRLSLYLMGLAFSRFGASTCCWDGQTCKSSMGIWNKSREEQTQSPVAPRAELQPCTTCGQPAPPGTAWALASRSKDLSGRGMNNLLGRSCLPGKAGGTRWSLEEGAAIFHFHWLLLGL